jgi:hypothetical protein
MSNFLKTRINHGGERGEGEEKNSPSSPPSPLRLNPSPEADAVLSAGRELWRYYHAKIKNIKTANVNASFYDIRAFFQGRNEKGVMNNSSNDDGYNTRIEALRETMKALAAVIQPKVYEYGFLRE